MGLERRNVTDPKDGSQTISQLKLPLEPGIVRGPSPLIGNLFSQPKLSSGILLNEDIGNSSTLIFSVLFQSELTENDQEIIKRLGVVILSGEQIS